MNTKLRILHLEDLFSDAELVNRALKKAKIDFERLVVDNRENFVKALTEFAPDKQLTVVLHHQDGTTEQFAVNHTYNAQQIEWFKAGGALNIIRKQMV